MSNAREAELEAQVRDLEKELALARGERPPVSGRGVLLFFGITLGAGVLAALSLFFLAKKTAAERKARQVKPAATRIDRAGAMLAREVLKCAEEKPMKLFVRVKLTKDGTMALLHATSEPEDATVVPCVRRAPLELRAEPGEGAGDVEVRYDGGVDVDNKRYARVTWNAGD